MVTHLTAGGVRTVTEADVEACLAARAGSLREALFDLYDLHERRRRTD